MPAYDPDILNAAFEFVTEWGENFGKPIIERMQQRFPSMTESEIAETERQAKQAEYRIYELAEMEERGEISESDITRIASKEFPWSSSDNIRRLKNIGMYYARK